MTEGGLGGGDGGGGGGCGKIAQPSAAAAWLAAEKVRRRTGSKVSVYKCQFCVDAWHLTRVMDVEPKGSWARGRGRQ